MEKAALKGCRPDRLATGVRRAPNGERRFQPPEQALGSIYIFAT